MTASSVLTIVLLAALATGGAGAFLLAHRRIQRALPKRGGEHRAAWGLAGAGCALLCAAVWGASCAGLLAFALCAVLAAITAIDHATRTIPNTLVAAAALIGALALILSAASTIAPVLSTALPLPAPLDWGTTPGTLPHALFPTVSVTAGDRILGIFAASVPLFIVALITGGFGGGDIKLLAALGLCLGWQLVLLAFFGAILLGGIYAVWLLITKRAGRKDAFAFGPFICFAAGLVAVVGGRLAPVVFTTVGLG